MAIYFAELSFMQKCIGLHPRGGYTNVVVQVILWTILVLTCVMETVYFVRLVGENFMKALAVLPVMLATYGVSLVYFNLSLRRNDFHLLLNELAEIIDSGHNNSF